MKAKSYKALLTGSFWCLLVLASRAGTAVDLANPDLGKPLNVTPFCSAFEDRGGSLTPWDVFTHPLWFTALDSLVKQSPASTYWVRTSLSNSGDQPQTLAVYFRGLCYVDLYAWSGDTRKDSLALERKAGTFRPAGQLHPGDGREYFLVTVPAHTTYTVFLKVRHTQHYWPRLTFYARNVPAFLSAQRTTELIDMGLLGAVVVFVFYSLLSWVVSRYRPYWWMLLFTAASGLFCMAMDGYLTDWFLPEHPLTGWTLNVHVAHAFIIGSLLLLLDFWKMKTRDARLRRVLLWLVFGLVANSVGGFCFDLFADYGGYFWLNQIDLFGFAVYIGLTSYVVIRVWKTLDRPGRIFGYGYILFLISAAASISLAWLAPAPGNPILGYCCTFSTLSVVMLFQTAIKEELRQHERDKKRMLEQLNRLQQEQNQQLEGLVRSRTSELEERNKRIEVLMRELHHRVKNNLQLLYGLMGLQLRTVSDSDAKEMLQQNLSRIRAMSIVNEKMHRSGDMSWVYLDDFVEETVHYVRMMYEAEVDYDMQLSIASGLTIPADFAVPFGLILTELLTNSFKYAVPAGAKPRISLSISRKDDGMLACAYSDNGCPKAVEAREGFSGLSLVKDLVRQLHGSIDTWYDQGLQYAISMPLSHAKTYADY